MKVTITKGESLVEALAKLNIEIPTHCGGNGTCGSCMVDVEGFGKVRACKFRLPGTYEVNGIIKTEYFVVGTDHVYEAKDKDTVFIGVDVGTTTIAMSAVYGEQNVTIGFLNPQRRFGADVMTRIEASAEHGDEMRELVRECILDGVARCKELLSEKSNSLAGIPVKMAISANTTMQYLLWGYDLAELGKAPFAARYLKAHDESLEGMHVVALPGISAFVGSDIVSGAVANGLDREAELSLFLDLGTNGEMLLGHAGKWIGTATAAGPAFEGSQVARHVHAAGVLRVLAHLKQMGHVDETGLLKEPYFSEGYDIASEGLFQEHLILTQEDIRHIQMAKAAIRAGIDELAKAYGVPLSSIKKVLLAGGMGYFIAEDDAITVGLLPEEFRGKITAVGNSSLAGAMQAVIDRETVNAMQQFVEQCQVMNLAEIPGFEEKYIAYMDIK